jgi:hypothetical protein
MKMFPMNWILKILWPIIKLFLDARTKKKVLFKNTMEEVFSEVDKEYIPKMYGGESQ